MQRNQYLTPFTALAIASLSAAISLSACSDDSGGSAAATTSATSTSATTSTSDASSTSSTSGTGGSGGEGGMGQGGAGGGPECVVADDCAGTDDECQFRTCDNGVCGTGFALAGTVLAQQMTGDCKEAQCDGSGGVVSKSDDNDFSDDGNDCTDDTCDMGSALNKPSMTGMACSSNGGKVCDGAGACVECTAGTDCASTFCDVATNTCIAATCLDNVKNGTETDTDCGGAACAPCPNGDSCLMGSDCQSGVCNGAACAAPACNDNVENGTETDVDCGGSCPNKCATTKGCLVDGDCIGGLCSGTTCLPTCTDTVKNNGESDIDCGGANCADCVAGQMCGMNGDCVSQACIGGLCAPSSCVNNMKDGAETDIDCGGGTCNKCPQGNQCLIDADCTTDNCLSGTCGPVKCQDGIKNGMETDVDCGGPTCNDCVGGKACLADGDCTSNGCSILGGGGICGHAVVAVGNGNSTFLPSTTNITAGQTVVWIWNGGGHNVVSTTVVGGAANNVFCSPNNMNCAAAPTSVNGTHYGHTFPAAGTFNYKCAPHAGAGMTGVVIVQ